MVICLERGADLHTAQLMPLPLTVSCFSKIQTVFSFLVPAHLGSPGKKPLNGCVCVRACVRACVRVYNTYFRLSPFFDIHISQGSVVTYLSGGGIFKRYFVANLLPSPSVKKI